MPTFYSKPAFLEKKPTLKFQRKTAYSMTQTNKKRKIAASNYHGSQPVQIGKISLPQIISDQLDTDKTIKNS